MLFTLLQGHAISSTLIALCIALGLALGALLDWRLGEVRRWHPLVGFGTLAMRLEQWLNPNNCQAHRCQLLSGLGALLVLLLPIGLGSAWLWWYWLDEAPLLALAFAAFSLYFSLGWRSLSEHLQAVQQGLEQNLGAGRAAVQRIVSRDCAAMDEPQVVRAGLETLLENTSDAIVAPFFWFLLLGPAGALVYRLSNTLDAMWGYRTPRLQYFGRAAARLDDLLNIIPARLTALAFSYIGNTRSALHCWRHYAKYWSSPNGGPVICAGSGALGVSLGGGAFYHGQWQAKPATPGEAACRRHIALGLYLVHRSVCLLLIIFVAIATPWY